MFFNFSIIQILITIKTVCSIYAVKDFPQLSHIKTRTPASVQQEAVTDLIYRLVGARVWQFNVTVDQTLGPKDRDTFKLRSSEDGDLSIEGTSGVAASMGFYHYLKYWVRGQRTWGGQQTQLPDVLPVLEAPVVITTNDRFRYYINVCTESYSFAFWQWDRWEQEIDWMALHGINLPLAFTGQEAIFQRVYLSLGLTQTELSHFFGGPAFLAWSRMGNIRGWGGPLTQAWISNKLVLQRQILERMRSLGMMPVLPGFSGHVPENITRVFPKANVTRSNRWGKFNESLTEVRLLDFEDPLFEKISSMFVTEMMKEFGSDHVYNVDTFNEMIPASGDEKYLASASRAVYRGLTSADPSAVWLMQGWLFSNARSFWNTNRTKALLTAVPQGRMIILDLAAEMNPMYSKFESFYGQPFIWSMFGNNGGTMALYGSVDSINKGPIEARMFPNSTLIGIGMSPEGIDQNEVMYEFMSEHSWRSEVRNTTDWVVAFAQQRYGIDNYNVSKAWTRLMSSVYNCTDHHHDNDKVFLTTRPSLTGSEYVWYKPGDLFSAWEGFINAAPALKGSALFRYDITDVTRNSLQIIFSLYRDNLLTAFHNNDTVGVLVAWERLRNVLDDLELLLNADNHFLLGPWLMKSKAWGNDEMESRHMEYNARNQITLWGPNGEIVDYASKQWAGVVKDFYKPRWELFSFWLVQLLKNKTSANQIEFDQVVFETVEQPWTLDTYVYPSQPKGDPVFIAESLYATYKPVLQEPFFDRIYRESKHRILNHESLLFKKEKAIS